jgi:purine-nucleoside phosphorylase
MTILIPAPSNARGWRHQITGSALLNGRKEGIDLEVERFAREQYEETAAVIRNRSAQTPKIGLVLGSGLGDLAGEIEEASVIPYGELPHFPQSSVPGHQGRLVSGTLHGQPVVAMQGRAHFYEGYSMQRVTFPVRVMKLLGVEILILTNAAGGLNPNYQVGDLMLICDHVNLPGMLGFNPLIGPNDPEFGPRFPDMTVVYDPELRALAHKVAEQEGLPLHDGIYMMLSGPSFETPAEVRYLRSAGADGVGMSTLPEVTVARHCGMRVLGCSGITNIAISEPSSGRTVDHEHVLAAGKILVPRMSRLLRGILSNREN